MSVNVETRDENELITVEACKKVVREKSMNHIGHHRCRACGCMVGYVFELAMNVYYEWTGDADELVVGYDSSCDCSAHSNIELRSWDDFVEQFNEQTREGKNDMWRRFVDGKALFEND